MTFPKRLTNAQRNAILTHIPIGGDLITVCNFAGVTVAQFRLEMKRDPAFAQDVAQAEAGVELRHMGSVSKAAQDEKNWRAGVWWIDRRTRARAAGDGRALSDAHFVELLDNLSRAIVAEIPDPAVQRRVIEALYDILDHDMPGGAPLDPTRDHAPAGLLAFDQPSDAASTDLNPATEDSQS